jgi:hypothetical protein
MDYNHAFMMYRRYLHTYSIERRRYTSITRPDNIAYGPAGETNCLGCYEFTESPEVGPLAFRGPRGPPGKPQCGHQKVTPTVIKRPTMKGSVKEITDMITRTLIPAKCRSLMSLDDDDHNEATLIAEIQALNKILLVLSDAADDATVELRASSDVWEWETVECIVIPKVSRSL